MDNDYRLQCTALVAELNAENAWELSPAQQAIYVTQVLDLLKRDNRHDKRRTETQFAVLLRQRILFYHKEHELIAILCNPLHPCHNAEWINLTKTVPRLLQKANLHRTKEDWVVSGEDLDQEALCSLQKSLFAGSYLYASNFLTWAHAVFARTVKNYLRSLGAKKRGANQTKPIEAAEAPDDQGSFSSPADLNRKNRIEEMTFAATFRDEIQEVLSEHPDERLAEIFWLWVAEDLTYSEIGKQVGLSTSRVFILLEKARCFLKQHPKIQAWNNSKS